MVGVIWMTAVLQSQSMGSGTKVLPVDRNSGALMPCMYSSYPAAETIVSTLVLHFDDAPADYHVSKANSTRSSCRA